jgi:signal transduction histidine kinase
MNRPWLVGVVFAACFAVVLATVVGLSVAVLRLERAEGDARQQAAVEENMRLALWRMESALAPLVVRENARPYFAYSSFYPAERAYTRMFSEIKFGDVLVPSPLLTEASPYILLHFQIDAAGALTSPQVPPERWRTLAVPKFAPEEAVAAAAGRLAELRGSLDRKALVRMLPLEEPHADALVRAPPPQPQTRTPTPANQPVQQAPLPQQVMQQQATLNALEAQARSRNMLQNIKLDNTGNEGRWTASALEGPLKPIWCDGLLLLARRVTVDQTEYVQGCWLDWAATQQRLAAEVADLFPEVRFEPLTSGGDDGQGRVLASLPVRVEPGRAILAPPIGTSPIRLFLVAAWIAVGLAGSAVIALLLGIVSLSERRAAFVSAVTHELRTPLTTFRLYTDLLTQNPATDPDKQRRYLSTMHAEAVRLAHLVENVLAYARLEHGRAGAGVAPIELGELLAPIQERLAERAAYAGMTLVAAPLADDVARAAVLAAPATVEQVLFNLVDNACKYANNGPAPEVRLTAGRDGPFAVIRLRDRGPGVPVAEIPHLFRPFHKSAHEAAQSAPGVGLGLALSRRLARSLGGDLRLAHDGQPGACFELILRAAPA